MSGLAIRRRRAAERYAADLAGHQAIRRFLPSISYWRDRLVWIETSQQYRLRHGREATTELLSEFKLLAGDIVRRRRQFREALAKLPPEIAASGPVCAADRAFAQLLHDVARQAARFDDERMPAQSVCIRRPWP